MTTEKTNRLSYFILYSLSFILSLAAVRFLFNPAGYTFHDETQIANLYEYFKAIKLGQFPPRWAPDSHFGYGSPFLTFNYPLPYYLGFIINFLGFGLLHTFKILLGLSVLIGATGAFLLGSTLASPLIGLLSSVIYTYLPYHAVDVFVRGALGESFAIAIFPFVLLLLHQLVNRPTSIHKILLGLTMSLFLLSHQIGSLLGFPLIFIFLFIFPGTLTIKGRFISFCQSILITLGLASFYLFPLVFERRYINEVSPFNFYDHFPFIKQLIYSPWGYGASQIGPVDGMSFQLGLPLIVLLILVLLKFKNPLRLTLLSISAISLYLMNIRSSWAWNLLPLTQMVQFPWRILIIFIWISPLLLVSIAGEYKFLKNKAIVLFVTALIAVSGFSFYKPGELADHSDSYFLRRFLPSSVLVGGEKVSADYLNFEEDYLTLPKNAIRPKGLPKSRFTSLGQSDIKIETQTPFLYTAKINTSSRDQITFHTFNFPGWEVTVNQNLIEHQSDSNGFITFAIEPGNYSLEVRFKESVVRRLGNIISLGSLILLIQLLIYYSYTSHARKRT